MKKGYITLSLISTYKINFIAIAYSGNIESDRSAFD